MMRDGRKQDVNHHRFRGMVELLGFFTTIIGTRFTGICLYLHAVAVLQKMHDHAL